ncbi:MAG: ATP-binding protein [Verrucomicrobia bacterium]|nr:ATP-binding protein [Verrucomicrobiota bacterium]
MDDPSLPRALAPALHAALADTPVVCLLGPRQCGKSTLARTLQPTYGYVSLDDTDALALARSDPNGFMAALPDPVILDEIQRAPELLRTIKLAVDRDRRPGRFLLTGSANLLLLPKLGDSLAGRMSVLELHPLTGAELNRAPGGFLAAWLAGKLQPSLANASNLTDPAALAARIVSGGFPEPRLRTPARARAWHRDYLRALLERDVQDVSRVKEPRDLSRLLSLLALRTGELLNLTTLANELDLRRETVEHHLTACERLYLVRRLQPWHRHESKRLIKTPKVHFIDTGLAATLASLTLEDWPARRDRFGHLLETYVLQELIAQAGWTDPELRFWHYRDKDQVEVDVVLTHGAQTWGVEVKATATPALADISGLRRLAAQCGDDFGGGILFHAGANTVTLGDPRFLAVPLAKLWEM